MKTISDEDVAALVAARSVIADAVGHPARDAAIAAIDRISKVSDTAPGSRTITVTSGPGVVVWHGPHVKLTPPEHFNVYAVCELYGFDSLEVTEERAERAYRLRAGRLGRVKSVLVSRLDLELSPMPATPWYNAIHRLALELGVEDIGEKAQHLIAILTGSTGQAGGVGVNIRPRVAIAAVRFFRDVKPWPEGIRQGYIKDSPFGRDDGFPDGHRLDTGRGEVRISDGDWVVEFDGVMRVAMQDDDFKAAFEAAE
jgi:hypothetical protein